jgi:hypothetical protein
MFKQNTLQLRTYRSKLSIVLSIAMFLLGLDSVEQKAHRRLFRRMVCFKGVISCFPLCFRLLHDSCIHFLCLLS